MVGHGGSSAGSYLAYPTSPIPSHCASIVVTSTLRVNGCDECQTKMGVLWVVARGTEEICDVHMYIIALSVKRMLVLLQ